MSKRTTAVTPVNLESEYGVNELFFSKTDPIGNILTGNHVFIRVSQYSKAELIGQPHNIIRHPDMPRVVFKVLWDYIKSGKVISAYVKNMAKDGRYYWVIATVFPLKDGYLSIRIKPMSDYFKIVPGLYKAMLDAEESGGMNASLNVLVGALGSKGFKDYDDFMTKMLVEELNVRQKQKHEANDSELFRNQIAIDVNENSEIRDLKDVLFNICQQCQKISSIFDHLSSEFQNLLKIESFTDETTKALLKFSDLISILALNSSIETYRLGEKGATLSVVSKAIKKDSEEIESYAMSVSSFSKDVSSQAQQLSLLTSTSRIQSDMVYFFSKELLNQIQKEKVTHEDLIEIRQNIELLVKNFELTFTQVNIILKPLGVKTQDILGNIESINKIIRNLERSDVLGNIEASMIGQIGEKFIIVFKQMRDSTDEIRAGLISLGKYLKSVSGTIETITKSNIDVTHSLESIRANANKLSL